MHAVQFVREQPGRIGCAVEAAEKFADRWWEFFEAGLESERKCDGCTATSSTKQFCNVILTQPTAVCDSCRKGQAATTTTITNTPPMLVFGCQRKLIDIHGEVSMFNGPQDIAETRVVNGCTYTLQYAAEYNSPE